MDDKIIVIVQPTNVCLLAFVCKIPPPITINKLYNI